MKKKYLLKYYYYGYYNEFIVEAEYEEQAIRKFLRDCPHPEGIKDLRAKPYNPKRY